MKLLNTTLFLTAVLLVSASLALAKVTFLPGATGNLGSNAKQVSTDVRCRSEGYSYTSCVSPRELTTKCPYNASYYKSCDCPKDFQYTINDCKEAGAKYEQCGGLYRCY